MIVRLLTQDFDWDQYIDLTMRSFGPSDEAMVQPAIEPVVAAGRAVGAFDGDQLADGGSPDADAALDAAFAATPFMLDGS